MLRFIYPIGNLPLLSANNYFTMNYPDILLLFIKSSSYYIITLTNGRFSLIILFLIALIKFNYNKLNYIDNPGCI